MSIVGSVLLSVCPIFMALGAVFMDMNETHMYNKNWPPHAKFHNGQTISMAVVLGLTSLWYATLSPLAPRLSPCVFLIISEND
jgi:hypothetical protein